MHRSLLRKKGGKILSKKVKEICEEKICPIIENMGYHVIEVEYAKKSDGMNLTFFIDKEDGIKIDDCEAVSKAIDEPLEELNPTGDESYVLSVSSPGIDRPLKTDWDFNRNMGKEIEVTLFAKLNGQKKFIGTLKSYDQENVILETKGEDIKFDRKQIAHIVPVIKF